MNSQSLLDQTSKIFQSSRQISAEAKELETMVRDVIQHSEVVNVDPFVIGLTVFALACFVGYYVVWKVTPALHSPLMSVTNAISSVIIVGALFAAGGAALSGHGTSNVFGLLAVVLASINIFGGFIVTQRMLQMFSKTK
ncbi:MAG: proton-translocating transhydrogenase family protein [Alphaproteobacteria bacterium]|nr:proton-translocating transhydrogenase family protein [Alphaproteobacteria bacterium]